MTAVRETDASRPPRGVALHLADYPPGQAEARCFRVRADRRRNGVLDYAGLPALGEPHPGRPDLEAHAVLPRRTGDGWEVWVCYHPRGWCWDGAAADRRVGRAA